MSFYGRFTSTVVAAIVGVSSGEIDKQSLLDPLLMGTGVYIFKPELEEAQKQKGGKPSLLVLRSLTSRPHTAYAY